VSLYQHLGYVSKNSSTRRLQRRKTVECVTLAALFLLFLAGMAVLLCRK
jgi:hypothetical protein